MTTAILIALNVIAGLFLVAVVLLQAGKGADMGAAFGGANPAVFGPTGQGNVLQRITAATAAVFMGTSLALAVISARQDSIFDGTAEPPPLAAPVAIPGTAGEEPSFPTDEAAVAAPVEGAAEVEPAAGAAPSDAALGETVPTPEPGAASPAPAAAPPVASAPPNAAAPPSKGSPTPEAPPPAAEPPPASAVQ